ncbi:MAG: LacI family DNA-binding transcriptional regulator, partial [Anaerolineae bacterium]|nr:LacI family DNA-binding transcriptional regulator [Anaerolineae bacterium]
MTMRDVARKAGVSIKTVSRVVNNQGEISEATRQRVLAIIDELGYRPNRIARAMVTQRTHTIGLVIPDITNPFFSEMTRGVQGLAQVRDYNIFLCSSDEDPQEALQALHSLAAQGVDGIILFAYRASDDDLKAFADNYRPIVFINRSFEHPNVSLIMVDNYRGARLAVDYLI